MNVGELRKSLREIKGDTEIVVHVNRSKTYRINSIDIFNWFDDDNKPIKILNIRLRVERKKKNAT